MVKKKANQIENENNLQEKELVLEENVVSEENANQVANENINENASANEEKDFQMEQEAIIEEIIKYKRPDVAGGYLSDKEEVEYFKAVQRLDVIDNCMLGDFDATGKYVVNKAISDKLVKMKKAYVSAFEKSIYCESVKEFPEYGKINFQLKIIPNSPKGSTTVMLELLETVNRCNGYYQNTNHVALIGAKFKGEENIEKIFKFFNIVSGDDDEGALKEKDVDVVEIAHRIAYLQLFREGNRRALQKYQKDLYNKKIALLSKSNEGMKLLEDFNKEFFHINNKYTSKDNVDFYKHLNQLLDSIIERNIDFIKEDKETYKALMSMESASANLFNLDMNKLSSEMNAKQNLEQEITNKMNKSAQEKVEEKAEEKVEKKSEEKIEKPKEEVKKQKSEEEIKKEPPAPKVKKQKEKPKEKIKSKGKVEDIIDEDIDALESFVEKQQEEHLIQENKEENVEGLVN